MRGLVNLKNSCYFNSALQCLLHVPILTNHFNDNPYEGECEFTRHFSEFSKKFWKRGETDPLNPRELIRAFQKRWDYFTDDEEHDVQECVLCIIDILEEARPEIKEWIYGEYAYQIITRDGKKQRREPFAIHILTSDGDNLKTMMKKDVEYSVLTDYEDEGKKYSVATTRRVFGKLPRVFMISFDKKSHCSVIERLKVGDTKFRLVAAAVHRGVQDGGHYAAVTYHKKKWRLKDDEAVSELDALYDKAGYYLLMYIAM
jgi:ubiquitin C-terminal hydrolase